jgi:transcriptional regulator with XRE-family HTH domain
MSPFSSSLLALRKRHNLRQFELAAAMGYDRSLLSGLEQGLKGPPSEQFVESLIETLKLSPEETHDLRSAVEASNRLLEIEVDAPDDVYLFLKELREVLPQLGPSAVQCLRAVISLWRNAKDVFDKPIRRSKRSSSEEAAMP